MNPQIDFLRHCL